MPTNQCWFPADQNTHWNHFLNLFPNLGALLVHLNMYRANIQSTMFMQLRMFEAAMDKYDFFSSVLHIIKQSFHMCIFEGKKCTFYNFILYRKLYRKYLISCDCKHALEPVKYFIICTFIWSIHQKLSSFSIIMSIVENTFLNQSGI